MIKQQNEILEELVNERIKILHQKTISKYAKQEKAAAIFLCSFVPIMFCVISIVIFYLTLTTNESFKLKILFVVLAICCLAVAMGVVLFSIPILRKDDISLAKQCLRRTLKPKLKFYGDRVELSKKDFYVSKEIEIKIDNWQSCKMFIDNSKKQFAIKNARKPIVIYKFKDILSYQVIEDGKTQVQGRAGSALIGGAFFGLAGAIVGSSRARSIDEMCSKLALLIHINNLSSPQIEIDFLNNVSLKKSSTEYKNRIDNIRLICSHLEYIMNSKNLEDYHTQEAYLNNKASTAIKEELQELKELFDEGLITEEDYEQKKKQILGL